MRLQPYLDDNGQAHYMLLNTPPTWLGVSSNDYAGFYGGYGSSDTFITQNGACTALTSTRGRRCAKPGKSSQYISRNSDDCPALTVQLIAAQ